MTLFGIAWLVGGAIFTYVTYRDAAESGGTYGIFWGAIAFGLYRTVRGLHLMSRISHPAAANADTGANWYADPSDPSQWRYWDGRQWTEHRAPPVDDAS